MEIIKKETNKESFIFIGWKDDEEYYLDLGGDSVRGWSFMGLCPATEEELRERTKEIEPAEMLGIRSQEFDRLEKYSDYERFEEDMEEEWLNWHDIQAEREEDGETYYLGFGSGTDIFRYFDKNNIKTYEDYCEHFEEIGLTKKQFDGIDTPQGVHLKGLIDYIKEGQAMDTLKMTDEQKRQELRNFRGLFNLKN